MNPLTNVKNLNKMNERELSMGLSGTGKSWHKEYSDSAWIFVGGLPFELTEGDILAVFSQYGEIVNINMVRDQKTGKFKGFGFLCYEDQRSTVLAVDNFNGIKLLGRTIRVDHCKDYKPPKEHGDEDNLTLKIREQGCAPQLKESLSGEDDIQTVIKSKKAKKKDKKKKKEKKKKKKKLDKSDTDDLEDEVPKREHNVQVKEEQIDLRYEKYTKIKHESSEDRYHDIGRSSNRSSTEEFRMKRSPDRSPQQWDDRAAKRRDKWERDNDRPNIHQSDRPSSTQWENKKHKQKERSPVEKRRRKERRSSSYSDSNASASSSSEERKRSKMVSKHQKCSLERQRSHDREGNSSARDSIKDDREQRYRREDSRRYDNYDKTGRGRDDREKSDNYKYSRHDQESLRGDRDHHSQDRHRDRRERYSDDRHRDHR